MRYKALLETKAKLAAEIKRQADKIHAENRDFTPEEKPAWEAVNRDYDANEERLKIEQRAASVSGSIPGSPPRTELGSSDRIDAAQADADRTIAIASWMASASDENYVPTEQHVEAARRSRINLNARGLSLGLAGTPQYREFRDRYNRTPRGERNGLRLGASTMTVGTGSAGGFYVPTELLSTLELNMLYFGPMRQAADVMRTATGETINWPTGDDTGNVGEQLGEEGQISATAASTSPTVAETQFLAYKFSSKPIKVSPELLQDSIFDLPKIIGEMLGERIGRITNTKFTTGAGHGSTTCEGVVTAAATGVTAASATAFTADELIKLYHSVDIAYRPGASWMFHDSIVSYVRRFKDGQGQYLWQAGLQDGRPDLLLGCPVWSNNDMASALTTGQKLGLFGNFSKFKIRTVGQIRLVRLNELYMDNDQVGFVAFTREDSRLLNAGTNPMKLLVLA